MSRYFLLAKLTILLISLIKKTEFDPLAGRKCKNILQNVGKLMEEIGPCVIRCIWYCDDWLLLQEQSLQSCDKPPPLIYMYILWHPPTCRSTKILQESLEEVNGVYFFPCSLMVHCWKTKKVLLILVFLFIFWLIYSTSRSVKF